MIIIIIIIGIWRSQPKSTSDGRRFRMKNPSDADANLSPDQNLLVPAIIATANKYFESVMIGFWVSDGFRGKVPDLDADLEFITPLIIVNNWHRPFADNRYRPISMSISANGRFCILWTTHHWNKVYVMYASMCVICGNTRVASVSSKSGCVL